MISAWIKAKPAAPSGRQVSRPSHVEAPSQILCLPRLTHSQFAILPEMRSKGLASLSALPSPLRQLVIDSLSPSRRHACCHHLASPAELTTPVLSHDTRSLSYLPGRYEPELVATRDQLAGEKHT